MAIDGGDIIATAATLLVGASSFAAIYAYAVRPRVWITPDLRRTVIVLNPTRHLEIEKKLQELGVPNTSYDVAWRNRGHRAAKDIEIEVTTEDPIVAWEITPGADDMAGPWSVAQDPLSNGSNQYTIRIKQPRLHAKSGFRLLVGYNRGSEAKPKLRAFVQDRRIPRPFPENSGVEGASPFAGLVGMLGALAYLKSTTDGPVLEGPGSTLRFVFVLAVGVGALFLVRALWRAALSQKD